MTQYILREKLLSLKDDATIENAEGNPVFKVNGKLFHVREMLDFTDLQGNILCTIQARPIRLRETMVIMRGGQPIATVRKAPLAQLRERYSIELAGRGDHLEAHGHFLNHEYTITQGNQKIAEISKQRLRVRDTYQVDVEPGNDDIVILAITVCIDEMRD